MNENLKLFKKITCILGITFLVLGMVPLPMVSKITTAAASVVEVKEVATPKALGLPNLDLSSSKAEAKDSVSPKALGLPNLDLSSDKNLTATVETKGKGVINLSHLSGFKIFAIANPIKATVCANPDKCNNGQPCCGGFSCVNEACVADAPPACIPSKTAADCPTACGQGASSFENGCGTTINCSATPDCQPPACVPDAWSCPSDPGYPGGSVTDSCGSAHSCDAIPAACTLQKT